MFVRGETVPISQILSMLSFKSSETMIFFAPIMTFDMSLHILSNRRTCQLLCLTIPLIPCSRKFEDKWNSWIFRTTFLEKSHFPGSQSSSDFSCSLYSRLLLLRRTVLVPNIWAWIELLRPASCFSAQRRCFSSKCIGSSAIVEIPFLGGFSTFQSSLRTLFRRLFEGHLIWNLFNFRRSF